MAVVVGGEAGCSSPVRSIQNTVPPACRRAASSRIDTRRDVLLDPCGGAAEGAAGRGEQSANGVLMVEP